MVLTISKQINYERFETQSQNCFGQGLEAAGYIHVNLQYCVKWRGSMCSPQPRRLSKTSRKTGKAWGHSDAATQPRVRASRQAEQELEIGDFGIQISNDGTDYDIIDLIDDGHGGQDGIDGAEPEQNETGADSDCDSCCSLDSLASGPSLQHQAPPLKPTLPSDLCSGCQSLYRRAKKMRNPHRDKDPSSLSCDQWVLRKKRRPRILSNVKGRLWTHLSRIRKREQVEGELSGEERKKPVCSRPHYFLQRNLRRCVRQAVGGGKRRRKRLGVAQLRGQASGVRAPESGISKRRRLHSNSLHDKPGVPDESDREDLQRACKFLTFNVCPTSLTLETPEQEEDAPEQEVITSKQEVQRKAGRFRTLLAQLRGNSSAIVSETNI